MTPVIILSDNYVANSSEPWNIPNPDDIEPIEVTHPEASEGEEFMPYRRDIVTLGRPWALPGTEGLEHRLGGLSKAPDTGNVSYDPDHQWQMVNDRREKVERLQELIPPTEVVGPSSGELLLLSWGSTYGAARSATERAQRGGLAVAHVHLRHLNPFPRDLEDILRRYNKVLIPEVNMGQLALLVRGTFGMDHIISFPKVKGRPFTIGEIMDRIREII